MRSWMRNNNAQEDFPQKRAESERRHYVMVCCVFVGALFVWSPPALPNYYITCWRANCHPKLALKIQIQIKMQIYEDPKKDTKSNTKNFITQNWCFSPIYKYKYSYKYKYKYRYKCTIWIQVQIQRLVISPVASWCVNYPKTCFSLPIFLCVWFDLYWLLFFGDQPNISCCLTHFTKHINTNR